MPTFFASGSHHAPIPQHDPVRGQIVQRQEGRRRQGHVARPVVDHAGPDFDALGRRRKGRHRHNRIAHQTAFGLPDRLKAAIFGILHILDRIWQRMSILQIKCYTISHSYSSK